MKLEHALKTVEQFATPEGLTGRIADIEADLWKLSREDVVAHLAAQGFGEETLLAALAIKAVAGQVNVVIHALGILISLPHVLSPGEVVESLSIGAGNTGRPYDLVTDRQIAEFKFISWRGRDTIRQNTTFVDLFNLASADAEKRRVLYVLDKAHPLRFLRGGRAITSVLSKNSGAAKRFRDLHGDVFLTVRDYYATVKEAVEIIDLRDVVPVFKNVTVPEDEVDVQED